MHIFSYYHKMQMLSFGAKKHRGTRKHMTEDNSKLLLDNSRHLRSLKFQSTEIEFNVLK